MEIQVLTYNAPYFLSTNNNTEKKSFNATQNVERCEIEKMKRETKSAIKEEIGQLALLPHWRQILQPRLHFNIGKQKSRT